MSITTGRILTLIPTPLLHRTPSRSSSFLRLRLSRRLHCSTLPAPGPLTPREWSHFVSRIAGPGSEYGNEIRFHEFSATASLTLAFLNEASAFLDFARQFPTLFWRLPREDIKVVVENVSPSLFEDERYVASRMRSLVTGDASRVRDPGRPSTVDLMKFLLSYVHMVLISCEEVHRSSEVESSVRKLLTELVKTRGTSPESIISVHTPEGTSPESITSHTQLPEGNGLEPGPFGNNMEMKRGDWICTRCSFMNFAKNKNCRQCEELRPKKVLTGGEWECPECDFFNFSRNAVCLRCDCKKPQVSSPRSPPAPATVSGLGANIPAFKSNSVKPSAGSESKQQPSLTKITQLEKSPDVNGSVPDNDFSKFTQRGDNKVSSSSRASRNSSDQDTETMPMLTGENRFVVGKKKDRSLSSPIYKRQAAMEQAGSSNHVPFVPFPSNYFAQNKPDSTQASVISKNIDQTVASNQTSATISDHGKTGERIEDKPTIFYETSQNMDQTSQSSNSHNRYSKSENNSRADMSGAPQAIDDMPWRMSSLEGSAVKEPDPLDMSEEAKAERWFKRVAQIKDISELSQIPDEDFPSIMPLRKGVNRFVVSKRKTPLERRLTSSQYQRNLPVDNSESNPGPKDVQSH